MEATESTNMYPDLKPAEETVTQEAVPVVDPNHEMKIELEKTEEEIKTLKEVLAAKENYAAELRRKLGLTALDQISQSLKSELTKVQSSNAYQQTSHKLGEINEKVTSSEYYKKTSDTIKTAGEKTATVITSLGSSVSQRFSEMKNSNTFKSFEERFEGVGTSLMAKVSGSSSQEPTPASTPLEPQANTDPITTQPEAQAAKK